MRLPFFVWSQLVTALLLLLAFPALQAAAIFQLMDRLAGTSFFLPSGLVVGGVPLQGLAGGGNPLLWQHLFWFLAHPEVYVLILPAIALGLFQLPLIWNLFATAKGWFGPGQENHSLSGPGKGWSGPGHENHTLGLPGPGQKARFNPWGAKTLEWRDPDLSPIIPNSDFRDLVPIIPRPDTGTTAGRLGMWLFLASEAMFFASLFSGYVILRAGSTDWPAALTGFPWLETVLLVGASAAFGPSRVQLMAANALGLAFVAVKILNDAVMIGAGQTPAANLMLAQLVHADRRARVPRARRRGVQRLAGRPGVRHGLGSARSLDRAHPRDAPLLVVCRPRVAHHRCGVLFLMSALRQCFCVSE